MDPDQPCPSGSYGKAGWKKTQYKKVSYWKEAIDNNIGDTIICSDVDIQFLKKTKPFLIKKIKKFDILFQSNNTKNEICSGFFICKCSARVSKFMDIVLNKLKESINIPGAGEQHIMQLLLKDKSLCNLNYGTLPRNRFWSPGFKYKNLKTLDICSKIMVHHANWTEGVELKLDQLNHVKNSQLINAQQEKKLKPNSIKLNKADKSSTRIALCMSSLLRNFSESSYSYIARIINSLPDNTDFIGNFPDKNTSKSSIKALKKLKPLFNRFEIKFQKDPEFSKKELSMDQNMCRQRHGIEGNLNQWSSMKQCCSMIEGIESQEGFEYDWVIWSRPDLHFFNSLDNISNLSNKNIYFPAHDNHLMGLNDRFCMGSSANVKKRMNILDFFLNEWYEWSLENSSQLTWSNIHNEFQWNPELVLKHYINKLKLNDKKINLCFGKLREYFLTIVPFWHSIHGSTLTGLHCGEDIVNFEVLNKIQTFHQYKTSMNGLWHAVNILEDTSLMRNFPDINAKILGSHSIEGKLIDKELINPQSFIKSILRSIDNKILNIKY